MFAPLDRRLLATVFMRDPTLAFPCRRFESVIYDFTKTDYEMVKMISEMTYHRRRTFSLTIIAVGVDSASSESSSESEGMVTSSFD